MLRKTNSKEISYLKSKDKVLSIIIDKIGDLEYELDDDPYRFLVFTIIGQMLSTEIGDRIYRRLEDKCKGNVNPISVQGLRYDDLLSIGISKRKANTILDLTNLAVEDSLCFDRLRACTDKEVTEFICKIHGIGSWTAKCF